MHGITFAGCSHSECFKVDCGTEHFSMLVIGMIAAHFGAAGSAEYGNVCVSEMFFKCIKRLLCFHSVFHSPFDSTLQVVDILGIPAHILAFHIGKFCDRTTVNLYYL